MISIEQFLSSMRQSFVVMNTVRFNIRGASTTMAPDDLEQEVAIVLTQVYHDYASTRSEHELRCIGNRAVKNHIRDLYLKENATTRGGIGDRALRGRRAHRTSDVPALMLDIDEVDQEYAQPAQQLDRLILRESVEQVVNAMSAVEARAARALFRGEQPRALKTDLFNTVRRTIRTAIK